MMMRTYSWMIGQVSAEPNTGRPGRARRRMARAAAFCAGLRQACSSATMMPSAPAASAAASAASPARISAPGWSGARTPSAPAPRRYGRRARRDR
ncbi:hypothetical protein ACFQU2_11200 [Siccirubricoccus deserti]